MNIDDPYASEQVFNAVRIARESIIDLPDSQLLTGYDLLFAWLSRDVQQRTGNDPRSRNVTRVAPRGQRRAYRN